MTHDGCLFAAARLHKHRGLPILFFSHLGQWVYRGPQQQGAADFARFPFPAAKPARRNLAPSALLCRRVEMSQALDPCRYMLFQKVHLNSPSFNFPSA